MQISRRSRFPGEFDHELVWLSVSVVSLGMAAAWFALGLPWPRCLFHDLTGLPCLTCGMTRCAIQFFHGQFLAALRWNPLIFVALCALAIFHAYAFAVFALRAPRLRIQFQTQKEKHGARMLIIAAFALNWIYLLSHWRDY
jgi:Protein of unknown function (DUF2752)